MNIFIIEEISELRSRYLLQTAKNKFNNREKMELSTAAKL